MKIKISDRVTVRISGGSCEKFFNLCAKNAITLTDVSHDSFGAVCCMASSDFAEIRGCVRKSGVHITIIGKSGVGLYIKRRRKRYGFFAGAFAAALIMAYLTSCIWVIDIEGNKYVSDGEILSSLAKHGFREGCLRFGKDIKNLQNEVLIDMQSLAWLWVDMDGTRAVVKVRERGDSPVTNDDGCAYNIVASYDGYVTDIIARSGQKVIERGTVVREGDLLISGISSTNYRGNRYIHSDGVVLAETWRQKSGEYHHTKTTYTPSGRVKKKRSVNFNGFSLKLYINEQSGFKLFEKSTETSRLKIFKNIYLPISFTTDTFCEIIKTDTEITDTEVITAAVERLTAEIADERGANAETVRREYGYKKLENGNVFVTVTVESNENIAKAVKIDVEKTEDNGIGKSD